MLGFQRGMWMAGVNEPFPTHLAGRMAIATVASVVLLWIAQRVFARLEGNFAQEL